MEKAGNGATVELVPELFSRELRSAARKANHQEVDNLLATCERLYGRLDFYAEALSWAARAYAKKEDWAHAQQRAQQALDLAAELVASGHHPSSTAGVENSLSVAFGAGIEVTAQCHDATGNHGDAIAYLSEMEQKHAGASYSRRIRKNLLQRSLPGQLAIPIELTPYAERSPVDQCPFGTQPTLLFFWAHWCSDSRAQARTLARFFESPAAAGLQLIGITTLFGFVTKGNNASHDEEQAHLSEILAAEYPIFCGKPALDLPPLLLIGQENLQRYGASTLPTLVLVDREGVVRQYRSGQWKLDDLEKALTELSTTQAG